MAFRLVLVLLGLSLGNVKGHGFLELPRSRNYVAYQDGRWWSSDPGEPLPRPESCPHCLNRGGPSAVCGRVEDRNYDHPKTFNGGELETKVQAEFLTGGEVQVHFVLTAHHRGHVELKLCPYADAINQSCFDSHPLTFVKDLKYGAPEDPDHPERGYIAPNDGTITSESTTELPTLGGMRFQMIYRLPDNVKCQRCLLQWTYMTGNTCEMPGYDDVVFPSPSWRAAGGALPKCTNMSEDGAGAPERFWNCADVRIIQESQSAPSPEKPQEETPEPPPSPQPEAGQETGPRVWDASTVYLANDIVIHQGKLYRAKWWTQGEDPATSGQWGVWEPLQDPTVPTPVPAVPESSPQPDPQPIAEGPSAWDPSKVYVAGDRVIHQGIVYQAKWWTQGDDPTSSGPWGVWESVGLSAPPPPSSLPPPQSPPPSSVPPPQSPPPSEPPSPAPPTDPLGPGGEQGALENLLQLLESKKDLLEAPGTNGVFVSEQPDSSWSPSTVYKLQDMMSGIRRLVENKVDGQHFYVGTDVTEEELAYGRVNLAAFLAQSMQEAIRYDVCDENNWDMIDGGYPISNSCGQLGQSYQDYANSPYKCPLDPSMAFTASTNAKWWGAPPPLSCGPKSKYPTTGYWNPYASCENGVCDVYEGQRGGKLIQDPTPNMAGRTDVENCCWWGRGAIQLTGISNYGILNHFLGKGSGIYDDVDLCKNPQAICSSTEYPELKWISGLFYWLRSVQTYEGDGFHYMDDLREYVSQGIHSQAKSSFIQKVSCVVNRGRPDCPDLHGGPQRAKNFDLILDILFQDA